MTEVLGLVPSQVGFVADLGRRAAGFAATQVSEQFGQRGAQRNAIRAVINNCSRDVDNNILGCSHDWQPEALDHLKPEDKPRAMQQAAVERSTLPKLQSLRDRLSDLDGHVDQYALLPLVQYAGELTQRASHIFVPSPRPSHD